MVSRRKLDLRDQIGNLGLPSMSTQEESYILEIIQEEESTNADFEVSPRKQGQNIKGISELSLATNSRYTDTVLEVEEDGF